MIAGKNPISAILERQIWLGSQKHSPSEKLSGSGDQFWDIFQVSMDKGSEWCTEWTPKPPDRIFSRKSLKLHLTRFFMGFRARVKCGIWLKYPKESLFMLAFWCFFTVASYMLLMKVHFLLQVWVWVWNRDSASESVVRTRGPQAATVRCPLKEKSGTFSSSERVWQL